jgi:type II secretory pathway pseudopilin PulG
MRRRACRHSLLPATLVLALASLPALAVRLVPDRSTLTTGEEVAVHVEGARTSVSVKWRSSLGLRLDEAEPGSARFIAVTPGQAMVMATVDGQLASVPISIQPASGAATAAAAPAETAPSIPAIPPRPVPGPGAERVSEPAYLRDLLPPSTFAYLRIPSIWGVLGAPSGNIFDQAVQSAPYQAAVLAVRSGVLKTILPEVPPQGRTLAELLLADLRSPLEIALMTPAAAAPQGQPQLPEVLITAALDRPDVASVDTLLHALVAQAPGLTMPAPLQPDGTGMLLVGGGLPLDLYFDAAQHRLFLGFAGPGSAAPSLAQRAAALRPDPDHPMKAAERTMDSSGQGLFAWLSPAPLLQAAEAAGKAREVALLRAFGASEAKSLALGMGASGGKQRIKLALEMPQVGFRTFLPAVHTDLPLETAGAPDSLLMLGLPGPEDLAKLEASLQGLLPADAFQEYQAVKAQLPQLIGLSAEQLLGAFGPELLVVSDKAGWYSALRLRDPAAFQSLLGQLVQRLGLKHETRQLLGTTFHHLVLPAARPATAPPTGSAGMGALEQRLTSTSTHLYWIEEHGYLLFSEVPQTLMDYLYIQPKVALGPWLRQSQGVDASGALLLASTRTDGVPRLMYELNLWVLSYLGDLTGQPIDLFSLPSPYELHLPDAGAYSFQIDSSPSELGVELVYESNPVELLMAIGGMKTAVISGILAAVAIPSLTRLESRAQLQGSLSALRSLEQRLTEFRMANGRYPSADEVDGFLAEGPYPSNTDLSLQGDTGKLTARFTGEGLEGGNELTLTPDPDGTTWRCSGSFTARHAAPGLCQQ